MQVTAGCEQHSFHRLPIRQQKLSNCDSASKGNVLDLHLPKKQTTAWVSYMTSIHFFHKGALGKIQCCGCPYPGSCCGYRVPRGAKSKGSKAAKLNAAAHSPPSAANKIPTIFCCEIMSSPPRGGTEEVVLGQPTI